MSTFVLEIGSEEIPARFIAESAKELENIFAKALNENSLEYGQIRTLNTPRRLALIVEDLSPVQQRREDLVLGPALKVAYTEDGAPTKALEGFAHSVGVSPKELFTQKTDKGDYLAARKVVGGRAAGEILSEICPGIISQIPFAKRMRWGAHSLSYARPLRWILALLDENIVPFKVGHLDSARLSFGHRVHGSGPYELAGASAYSDLLEKSCAVMPDPESRRQFIISKGNELAAKINGRVLWDEKLIDEVVGLVEHPLPILANFDPAYLEVPAEVLLCSMQSHQKSFGIVDNSGQLFPHFLTVLNITPKDIDLVRHGWERVLRARLEDARFFWRTDLKANFADWLEKLDQVIFIGSLGSIGEKSRRLERLCQWLADQCALDESQRNFAARAGLISKADLVSAMVGEFDTLQGIMGGIYAAQKGEPAEVAKALREQYLPSGPDSPLPESVTGAILSIADKADTLAGCFGLNRIPTGAADPNGLRRCALGIIRIAISFQLNFSLEKLMGKARELYGTRDWKLSKDESEKRLHEFFAARLRSYFQSLGYETKIIDSVLATGFDNLPDFQARLDAVCAFAKDGDFARNAQALKRVDNILRKQEQRFEAGWRDDLLGDDAEKSLAKALEKNLPILDQQLNSRAYGEAFALLKNLYPEIDNFFAKVMVLAEDDTLRRNRLGLLGSIRKRFMAIADFSLLQV